MSEPSSWGELLRQYEASRNQPPPREFYLQQGPIRHAEAGVISAPAPEQISDTVNADTRLYASTHLFEEAAPVPRVDRPRRDHGLDITSWPKQRRREREAADRAAYELRQSRGFSQSSRESGDFNIVTGVPHEAPFKSTVQQLLRRREVATRCETMRAWNPVTNAYPTEVLETRRLNEETARRAREFEYTQSRLPANERRAQNTLVNIVTGEAKDERAASAIREFPPYSATGRAELGLTRERAIVDAREAVERTRTARVGCRFNNGRMKEIRDWNIVNGAPSRVGWDSSVKMKPSVWQWLQAEKLDVGTK